MKREVREEPDLGALADEWQVPPNKAATTGHVNRPEAPRILNVADLLDLEVALPEMLFEGLPSPARGASLIVGASKSGKTLLAVQRANAVATGKALYDYHRVLKQGPVLIVEQDDPDGAASVKDILQRARVDRKAPLHFASRLPFSFGPAFLEWLQKQMTALSLQLVVLDSYTALRGPRGAGIDIVKAEQNDMMLINVLGKENRCAVELVHHHSKGSAGLDWSQQAAGTFAMGAATEAQIHVSRFPELDGAAPERLVRFRGRHGSDVESVLRFRKDTLDYEHVMEGGAAVFYPLLLQIQNAFHKQAFGPKELSHSTGLSRATAHRHIDRLQRAGALQKVGFGEYVLAVRELVK